MSEHITASLDNGFGDRDFDRLFRHTSGASAPLERWRQTLKEEWKGGLERVRECSVAVMRLIAEPKVLFTAAVALRAGGPKAPGRNKLRLESLDRDEMWRMCNALGRAIASGNYRPGKERIVWIEKVGGGRKRPIVVMDSQDRVVHKAVALVLRPLLDPMFDPMSFAFRANRGREHALAVAEQLIVNGNAHVLVHDLKDAFGRVPVSRLLEVVFKAIPCPRLRSLLELILPPESRALGGIKQGSPLSPILLELYLSHFLHEPWRRTDFLVRLLRYADDLLLLAEDRQSAEHADIALRSLLTPAGMILKTPFNEAIRDIREEPAEWLGFQFQIQEGKFRIRLGSKAFTKLHQRFVMAHSKCNPAERAYQLIKHWVDQLGPCYRGKDRDLTLSRALMVANEYGFEETPSLKELESRLEEAHDRWRSVRKFVRKSPGFLVSGPLVPPTPNSVIR